MKTIGLLPLLAIPFLMGAAAIDPLPLRLEKAERRITALEKANTELRSKICQQEAVRKNFSRHMKQWHWRNCRYPSSPYIRLPYYPTPSPHRSHH